MEGEVERRRGKDVCVPQSQNGLRSVEELTWNERRDVRERRISQEMEGVRPIEDDK